MITIRHVISYDQAYFNYSVKIFVIIMTDSSSPVTHPELNIQYLKLFKGLEFYHLLPPRATHHVPLSIFDLIFFQRFILLFLF